MLSFKSFTTENKIEDEFGKYLFGGYKNLEKDTPVESDLFNYLEEYFTQNKTIPPKYVKKLKELKSKFPDVLKPDRRDKTAFRSTVVYEHEPLIKFIMKNKAKAKKFGADGIILENYTYSPKSEMQSWSTSMSAAERFTPMNHGEGGYAAKKGMVGILLETKINDDFIFNTDFTNDVGYSDEYETFRISKAPTKCTIYLSGRSLYTLGLYEEFN